MKKIPTRPSLALVLALLVFSVLPLGQASAQSGSGAGWNAWLGCWEPVGLDPTASVDDARPALCVIPGATDAQVELVTVEDGVIVDRETLNASGAEVSSARDGCQGVESTSWSADGSRLYQESVFECPGELERRTSGIFAITPSLEWIAVEAVTVDESTDVRVVRYRPAPGVARSDRELSLALEGRAMAIDAARTSAAAPADFADVIEANTRASLPAVEAWLIEQEEGFDLDARRIRELAAAGVPEPLIDLMVALSYPDVFAIDRTSREGDLRENEGRMRGRRGGGGGPWYFPRYGGGFYPGYWGGWYGRPVIVVRNPDFDVDRGGRAVNGRGYTRRGSGGGSSTPSEPRTSTGGGNGGGSIGGGGGGGSDTGRTAKPR